MTTFFITHPSCLEHEMTDGHPESPERLKAILAEVMKPDYQALEMKTASKAAMVNLLPAHSQTHIDFILSQIPKQGLNFIDGDTSLCPASGEAALHAAGAVIDAVKYVLEEQGSNAFCAIRPPGHHAHRDHAAGFCLFNNLAAGVYTALEHENINRVAIVDFDVHHGDGTQDIIWDEERVLFISTHEYPLYPGTGKESERGAYNNTVNFPVKINSDGSVFRKLFDDIILPRLHEFKPDMIFISAGYDAHEDDPLANLSLTDEDYGEIMGKIVGAARELSEGRLVAVLEGGYNINALARSVGESLKVMMK